MPTYLDKILASAPRGGRADDRDVAMLVAEAQKCPPARGFAAALRNGALREVAARP